MNIMNRLTQKHMLTNKKRTLVTILGIIISVAMFTAVFTGVTSILGFFQRMEMSQSGFWHVQYDEITSEIADALEEDSNTDNIAFYKDLGYSRFENSTNAGKPYLYLTAMDDKSYEMMSVSLIEGRLPANSDEIVIPTHLLKFSSYEYKVGDTITLTLGNRYLEVEGEKQYLDQTQSFVEKSEEQEEEAFEEVQESKTYTIVGVVGRPNSEFNWSPGFSVFTKIEDLKGCNARVYLNHVTRSIYKDTNAIQEKYQIPNVEYNHSVLSYYGISRYSGFNSMINGVIIILIIIIMVGSISLIYNSFAISISERTKQFGMLASVGATKRQKLCAVLYEGVICGCISIPIGILSGILGLSITFRVITPMLKNAFEINQTITTVVSIKGIIAAVIISMITILLSAYLPARKASKITPMEAIQQQKDIKIKSKTVKNSKLVRNLFGLEGDLALKNLKRNKKRYRTIVFSIGISVILFISVNSYTYYLSQSLEIMKGTNEGDITVGSMSKEEVTAILPELLNLDELSDIVIRGYYPGSFYLSKEDSESYMTKELKEYCAREGMTNAQLSFSIYVVDDDNYRKLQKETKIVANADKTDPIPVLIVNQQRDAYGYSIKDIIPLNITEGNVVSVCEQMNKVESDNISLDLYIEGKVINLPLGMSYYPCGTDVVAIMSMATWEQLDLIQTKQIEQTYFNITANTTNPEQINSLISDIASHVIPESDIYISNQAAAVMRSRQVITIFNIFVYGFITLISLISVANICNTISTSFSIRRREFAMIKSVGMTPESFRKMIIFESLLYGIKSLIFGIPVGALFNFAIYKTIHENISSSYAIPYTTYIIAIIFVFIIVGIAMLYSTSKTRKDNIIDGLKSEII